MSRKREIRRGNVVVVNLEPIRGSEQGKVRPCLVLQNDIGNQYSPVTIVACLTSGEEAVFETEVEVKAPEGGLKNDSLILLNQIRTIDKERILAVWGKLSPETLIKVDEAIKVSLGLFPF